LDDEDEGDESGGSEQKDGIETLVITIDVEGVESAEEKALEM
jgi:hypothetical protein